MAAHLSLTQLSSANPVYEKFYRQVDSANTGRVLASDAAVFLKKSGLTDLVLGKIWDLADTDGKGILNKQEFFVALRLVEEEKEIPAATITKKEDPFDAESHPLPDLVSEASLEFFQSDPFVGSDPFKDDPFGKIDPFGGDPFKGSDPFAADCFFKQSSTDPFVTAGTDPFNTAGNSNNTTTEILKKNDPFAPGGTTVTTSNDLATDPFASLFGNESFGSGFADFSTLSKASTEDPFSSSTSGSSNNVVVTKNLFEEPPSKNEDVPPALPPKTGTPTRPCPPPPVFY